MNAATDRLQWALVNYEAIQVWHIQIAVMSKPKMYFAYAIRTRRFLTMRIAKRVKISGSTFVGSPWWEGPLPRLHRHRGSGAGRVRRGRRGRREWCAAAAGAPGPYWERRGSSPSESRVGRGGEKGGRRTGTTLGGAGSLGRPRGDLAAMGGTEGPGGAEGVGGEAGGRLKEGWSAVGVRAPSSRPNGAAMNGSGSERSVSARSEESQEPSKRQSLRN